MTIIHTISLLNIGFSILVALILLTCYAFFLKGTNRSWIALGSCALLLTGLSCLQFEHFQFLIANADPLDTRYYRLLLFLVPPMFFIFSRTVLFPDEKLGALNLIHFLPSLLVFFVIREIAVPIAFLIGTGYSFWLAHVIYHLKDHRKRFEVEFFFFGFFSVLAVLVLILGFSVSYIDNAYFYYFYTNGIGLAFILVTAALIVYPDLLNELTEVVKLGYSSSTLGNINVDESLEKLDKMMLTSKMYQNENLNLSLMAEAMGLSGHQLSELINTHYSISFSKYIRQLRVEEAKKLLRNQPKVSILSISMEIGFKSQSNFYAAFKDITGSSPGNFRKAQSIE